MAPERIKTRQALLEERFGRNRQPVQQNTQSTIRDQYIKTIVERYQNSPHYTPQSAGVTELDVDMALVQQRILSKQQELQRQAGVSITADDALARATPQQRAALAAAGVPVPGFTPQNQQQSFKPQQQPPQQHLPGVRQPEPQPQQHMQQPQQQTVQLREGHTVYHMIQQNFGSGLALVRPIGVVTPQLANQQLIMRAIVESFVVHPHQQTINMQEAEKHKVRLLSIIVPPMVSPYPILVEENAVVGAGQPSYGGRQLINDGRIYRPQQPQQQARPTQPQQRYPGMLTETPWRR